MPSAFRSLRPVSAFRASRLPSRSASFVSFHTPSASRSVCLRFAFPFRFLYRSFALSPPLSAHALCRPWLRFLFPLRFPGSSSDSPRPLRFQSLPSPARPSASPAPFRFTRESLHALRFPHGFRFRFCLTLSFIRTFTTAQFELT